MNGMNFKPFISKLLGSLSDEDLATLASLIDTHSNSFTNRSLINPSNYLSTSDKGVGLFTIQLDKDTIRTGYLIYNNSYCVLLSYVPTSERIVEFQIDVATKTYSMVKEFLTTDYLRHEVAIKSVAKGEGITVQANDIESGSETAGKVLMADGDGGAEWGTVSAGGSGTQLYSHLIDASNDDPARISLTFISTMGSFEPSEIATQAGYPVPLFSGRVSDYDGEFAGVLFSLSVAKDSSDNVFLYFSMYDEMNVEFSQKSFSINTGFSDSVTPL